MFFVLIMLKNSLFPFLESVITGQWEDKTNIKPKNVSQKYKNLGVTYLLIRFLKSE